MAALERLDLNVKVQLGNALVDRILHHSSAIYDYWALGRIGARHLLYGSVGQVVPKEIIEKWIEKILHHGQVSKKERETLSINEDPILFLFRQLARKTDHRELNLSEATIQKILGAYPLADLQECLLKEKEFTQKDQEQAFGERLPLGLVLECPKSSL